MALSLLFFINLTSDESVVEIIVAGACVCIEISGVSVYPAMLTAFDRRSTSREKRTARAVLVPTAFTIMALVLFVNICVGTVLKNPFDLTPWAILGCVLYLQLLILLEEPSEDKTETHMVLQKLLAVNFCAFVVITGICIFYPSEYTENMMESLFINRDGTIRDEQDISAQELNLPSNSDAYKGLELLAVLLAYLKLRW